MRKPFKPQEKKLGAVVLCGGNSQRMGFDKWKLPLGDTSLLQHIVDSLSNHIERIVISMDADTRREIEISNIEIAIDQNRNCGPLEGIRAGLQHLANDCQLAFVTACDTPFPNQNVIDYLVAQIGNRQAVIPIDGERVFPLNAVYRTDVHLRLYGLIQNGSLRAGDLAQLLDAAVVPAVSLREFDPDLKCLTNINEPRDYFELLELLGISCQPELKELLTAANDR